MPSFNFASISDFFAMGGYGFYVWLSFGGSLLAIGLLALYSCRQQRTFIRDQASRAAREARVRQQQSREQ